MISYAKLHQPHNTDTWSFFTHLPSDMQTFLCTGNTDLRKSIDGLSMIVEKEFGLNPYSKSMYLFCGERTNLLKGLYFDGFAFVELTVRSDNIKFKWPQQDREMWKISRNIMIQLLNGNSVQKEDALRVFKRLPAES